MALKGLRMGMGMLPLLGIGAGGISVPGFAIRRLTPTLWSRVAERGSIIIPGLFLGEDEADLMCRGLVQTWGIVDTHTNLSTTVIANWSDIPGGGQATVNGDEVTFVDLLQNESIRENSMKKQHIMGN